LNLIKENVYSHNSNSTMKLQENQPRRFSLPCERPPDI